MQWSPQAHKRQVCDQLHETCGAAISEDECGEVLEGATPSEVEDLANCVEPAESCLEVAGCLAGTGARQLSIGVARGLFPE